MIDVKNMQVGDRIRMPSTVWKEENQAIYQEAQRHGESLVDGVHPKYEVESAPISNREHEFWLKRTR